MSTPLNPPRWLPVAGHLLILVRVPVVLGRIMPVASLDILTSLSALLSALHTMLGLTESRNGAHLDLVCPILHVKRFPSLEAVVGLVDITIRIHCQRLASRSG